jgi:hypothetical protein
LNSVDSGRSLINSKKSNSWIFWKRSIRYHTRLLHKLRYYGIRNNTFLWIQDFLSHWTQEVQLEGHK